MSRQSFTHDQVLRTLRQHCAPSFGQELDIRPSKRGSVAIAHTKLGMLVVKYADLNNIETEEQIVPPRSTGIRNEAQVISKLSNGLAPKLYTFGEDEASVFSITEHIVGNSLLNPTGMNKREVVGSFIRAVAAVHQAGVIHGDITPHNALASTANEVRLVDFELSHQSASDAIAPGLYHYLSPEAAAICLDDSLPALDVKEETFGLAASCLSILTGDLPVSYSQPDVRRKQALTEIASGQPYSTAGASADDMPLALLFKETLEAPSGERPATPEMLYAVVENHL